MAYKLVGATRFYERKEIKDVLAYLKLVHNPSDTVAMDRIINVPARGIGPKTYVGLKSWADRLSVSPYNALRVLHHGAEVFAKMEPEVFLGLDAYDPPPLGVRAARVLADFGAMLEKWITQNEQDTQGGVVDLLDAILAESGYVDALRDGSDEAEDRFANIQELRGVAAQYVHGMIGTEEGLTPLGLFLEEISLVSDIDDYDTGSGAVTLLTLHTAKGLEFPVVFIVGMEDGVLPHSRSIESEDEEEMDEERRLCYVGMTRAMQRLYLLHCFRRTLWGSSEVQQPSRFFDEVPQNLINGMVEKQSRREASYQQATTWDNGTWWDGDSSGSGGHRSSSRGSAARTGRSKTRRSKSTISSNWLEETTDAAAVSSSSSGKETVKTTFKARDSVEHGKFGVGTVIESKAATGGEEVTVAFPGIGIKRLMANYLTKL